MKPQVVMIKCGTLEILSRVLNQATALGAKPLDLIDSARIDEIVAEVMSKQTTAAPVEEPKTSLLFNKRGDAIPPITRIKRRSFYVKFYNPDGRSTDQVIVDLLKETPDVPVTGTSLRSRFAAVGFKRSSFDGAVAKARKEGLLRSVPSERRNGRMRYELIS